MTNVTAPDRPAASTPEHPYARHYAHFLQETSEHSLTVVFDAGLRKHLRVGKPGTRMWGWELITWPGYLATVGDIADGYLFRREEDMIAFMRLGELRRKNSPEGVPPSIDYRYWAEKLVGQERADVRTFSDRRFLESVQTLLEEHDELGLEAEEHHDNVVEATRRVLARNGIALEDHLAELERRGDSRYVLFEIDENDELEELYYGEEIPAQSPRQRREEYLADARVAAWDRETAIEFLRERAGDGIIPEDWYELQLDDWDVHFLHACWAIELTIRLWDEHVAAHGTSDDFILVDGGLVKNGPALPVFDLDVLDSDVVDGRTIDEMLDLRERILAHPRAARRLADTVARIENYVRADGDEYQLAQLTGEEPA